MSGPGSCSRVDRLYRSLLLTRFFTRGWGNPEHMKRIFSLRRKIANREFALTCVDANHEVTLTKDRTFKDHRILEGHFMSPAKRLLEEILPSECETAHFQVVVPVEPLPKYQGFKPMCIQYAGTGDHFFWRRRLLMALPLLREKGVSSIILENPFYGLRKPKDQLRSSLQNVTDLFVMGACLMLESMVLYNWAEKHGYGPLVAHGISMGGHMACLGATCWPKPIGIVPCLSLPSGAETFTEGVMSHAIPWDLLEKQYSSTDIYRTEIRHFLQSEKDAFQAGVDYAHEFNLQNNNQTSNSGSCHTPQKSDSQKIEDAARASSYFKILRDISLPPILAPKAKVEESKRKEAILFMQGIMDECTHIKNYTLPFDPSLAIAVAAENDAYQPKETVSTIPKIWPGSQVRWVEGDGHVSSYLFKQHVFRKAIYDVIDRTLEKHYLSS